MSNRRAQKTTLDRARDELFSHIHRCGVLDATEEQQREWIDDTIVFLAERFPDLGQNDVEELRRLGLRFCQPVIPHGTQTTAQSQEDANAA